MDSFIQIIFLLLFINYYVNTEDVLNILNKLLRSFHNYENITPNIFFGLWFANGQLISALPFIKNVTINHEMKRSLKEIKVLKDRFKLENLKINQLIIFSQLPYEYQNDRLIWYEVLPKYYQFRNIVVDFETGELTRDMSDFCISQLFSTKTCSLCQSCVDLIFSNSSRGYYRTHQILMVMFIRSQKCHSLLPFNISIEKVLYDLCYAVLEETLYLMKQKVGLQYQDLFIEQVLFCGQAGFSEFYNEKIIKFILSWQENRKCFSGYSYENENHNDTCLSHINGVGIALLGQIVKLIVELSSNMNNI